MTNTEGGDNHVKNYNLLRAALCCFLIAVTVLAQEPATQTVKTPPAAQAPPTQVCPANTSCAPTAAKPQRQHHGIRTVLIIVGVVAVGATAGAVAALHKTSAAAHCNGPNPLTCAP